MNVKTRFIVIFLLSSFLIASIQAQGNQEKAVPKILVNGLITDGISLYASTEQGIFYSADNGESWKNSEDAYYHVPIINMALWNNIIYTIRDGYIIYYSTNKGKNWVKGNTGIPEEVIGSNGYKEGDQVESFAVRNGKLFAVGQHIYQLNPDNSWKPLSDDLDGEVVVKPDFKRIQDPTFYYYGETEKWTPLNGGKLWFHAMLTNGTAILGIGLGNTEDSTARLSTNAGLTWETGSLLPYRPTGFLATSQKLFIWNSTNDAYKAFFSDDKGKTWTALNFHANEIIHKGAFFFAATNEGIYRLEETGKNWKKLNTFNTEFRNRTIQITLTEHTVTIAKQIWTQSNLKIITFQNGDTIPEAASSMAWEEAGRAHKPAWCYQQMNEINNSIEYRDTCGKLYNWYALNDKRGFAPKGWHVPSKAEWNQLIKNLGDGKAAGDKMRRDKDSTGFAAIAAGHRYADGENDHKQGYAKNADREMNTNDDYFGFSDESSFWTSSADINDTAWSLCLSFINSNVFFQNLDRGNGRSVRFIRN
jgi:uncharacterized protein (TIGR02145 family)